MKISILCTSNYHPVYSRLVMWAAVNSDSHDVELVNEKKMLAGGEILFLISCNEIIDSDIRDKYKATLVIHASALPKGRGWSPHIWQILEGKREIVVSLLEAEDVVDCGAIWAQNSFSLEGHELWDEINDKLFAVEMDLLDFAVENFESVTPVLQDRVEPTSYPKRTPKDSCLDPSKSIKEQFDLLRVCDPERFPAYFELRGHQYKITLQKLKD